MSFTLDDLAAVQGLRWDPLESRTCRLRLDAVEWEDRDGQVHPLDPAVAGSNGKVTDEGLLAFETLDPMVFLPVRGDVVRMTVAGWYEADDLGTSLACVETALQIAQSQLRERDEQLRVCEEQLRLCEEEFRGADGGAGGGAPPDVVAVAGRGPSYPNSSFRQPLNRVSSW